MITREDMVQQSAQEKVKSGLVSKGYPTTHVVVRNSFPSEAERATPLEKTSVAGGFNFDDGGRPLELGSDTIMRVYTIEFWTFGTTPEFGANVAHIVRAIWEDDYTMDLLDIRVPEKPVIDKLLVVEPRGVVVTRQIARDPRPWDMNVWTTTVKLEDVYSPSSWD